MITLLPAAALVPLAGSRLGEHNQGLQPSIAGLPQSHDRPIRREDTERLPRQVVALDPLPEHEPLRVLAGTDAFVRALAIDLHSRHRRWDLLDVADHRRNRVSKRLVRHASGVTCLDDIAPRILGCRRDTEAKRCVVVLVGKREMPEQARAATDADDEHAGRHRVESPCMSDATGAGKSPDPRDDVVRGPVSRLVDDDKTIAHGAGATASCARSRSAVTLTSSYDVKPAASLCPPPPSAAHTAPTSVAPRDRGATRKLPSPSCLNTAATSASRVARTTSMTGSISSSASPADARSSLVVQV